MTPKELKRLSRSDLLEMLLDLTKENEQLRKGNEHMSAQLTDRKIAIDKCGSLAEAALQLNGIFQAAEAACSQYTENILARSEELEAHCNRIEQETVARCNRMEQETVERCNRMEQETADRCNRMDAETRQACEQMLAQAQAQAQAFMDEAMAQRDSQNQEYQWLADIMNGGEV